MPYVIYSLSYDEDTDSYQELSLVTDCYGVKDALEDEADASVYYIEDFPDDDELDLSQLTPLTSDEIAALPEDTDRGELVTDDAFDVDEINANVINTNNLIAITTKIVNADIESADITTLNAEVAKIKSISTISADISTLETAKADVKELEATQAKVSELESNILTADSAIIQDLKNNSLTSDSAIIKSLQTNSMTTDFANIAFEDVDTANIAQLFAHVGLIDRATIVDGHITGFLDAVEINANNITAGTLIAERIALVQTDEDGNQTGLIYALNNLGELSSTSVNTIDGAVITKRTITADHIAAHSLTAQEIDVADLFAQTVTATNLTISGNSKLQNITASNIILSGNINASSGTIAGANITGAYLSCETFSLQRGKTTDENYLTISANELETVSGYSYNLFDVSQYAQYGNVLRSLAFTYDGIYFGCAKKTDSGDAYNLFSYFNTSQSGEARIVGSEIKLVGPVSLSRNLSVSEEVNAVSIYSTNSMYITSKWNGYYVVDSADNQYPAVYDNGTNLWIGSEQTTANHHVGGTYISAGYNATSKKGNATAFISVPNATNDGGTNYSILHTGNLSSNLPVSCAGTRGCAEMLAGTFDMSSIAGGKYDDKTYTFSSGTFSGTPNVVICKYDTSPGESTSGAAGRTLTLMSKSATSIKVRAYNNGSASWTPKVSFFAIYRGS